MCEIKFNTQVYFILNTLLTCIKLIGEYEETFPNLVNKKVFLVVNVHFDKAFLIKKFY